MKSPGWVSTSIDPQMLLDDDFMTMDKAKPGALSGGLRRKEGIEHRLLYLGWNADASPGILISTRSLRFFVAAVRTGS